MQKTTTSIRLSRSVKPSNNLITNKRSTFSFSTSSLMLASTLAATMLITGCNQTQADATDKATAANQNVSLLNVSYDVSRDFYKEYNPLPSY